jgi:hypothetical protein
MVAKKAVTIRGENLKAAGPVIQQLQPCALKGSHENPLEPPDGPRGFFLIAQTEGR